MLTPTRARTAFCAGALALTLAACGSQLEPGDVVAAGGTQQGVVGGAVVPGAEGSAAPGTVPGSGPAGTVGSGGTGATTTGGGSTSSGSGTATGGGGTSAGGEENSSTGGAKAASCDGFDGDQPGVSADKIVLANASDISGPVPGIFESSQQGMRAYLAFFNSTNPDGICGRKLEALLLDSRADAGADQQAYARACADSFAAVGSQSAFDSGGAGEAQKCGLPDLRAYSLSTDRTNCTTCYAAYAVRPGLVPNAMPQYWVDKEPDAVKSVGMIYINAGAAPENAEAFRAAWEKNGWDIKVFQGMDTSEFNYTPYVQQMKDAGVEFVNYTGPYQNTVKLQQAMQQAGFEPEIFMQDATIHDDRYVEQAGDLADGVYVYSQTALFDDYSIPEMELYRSWLAQIDPDATPNTYGVYAWSATRLFVELAVSLGGDLTRQTLLEALTKVEGWTSNGIHVPQNIAAKTTANCARIIQYTGGAWKKISPGEYMCGSMTDVS